MYKKPNNSVIVGVMATTLFVVATFSTLPAQAMPSCADPAGDGSALSIAGNVVTNAGCQLGTTNNDSLAQVNADSFFGFSDWGFDARDNDVDGVDSGTNSLGLSLVGGSISGAWSISATAFSLFSDIMLVFKSGSGLPGVFVGYLLNSTSGSYLSPFVNPDPDPDVLKDISHMSLYARGTGTPPTTSTTIPSTIPPTTPPTSIPAPSAFTASA